MRAGRLHTLLLMKPTAYYDHLQQTSTRVGLDPSDLQAAAVMDIITMERTLGFALCECYQEFLSTVGCGPVFGGLGVWLHLDVTRPGNLLDASRGLAREMAPATRRVYGKNTFPRDMLVVYDACDGDLFGFLPEKAKTGRYQPAVYAWNTEDLELREAAPCFRTFLGYLTDGDAA